MMSQKNALKDALSTAGVQHHSFRNYLIRTLAVEAKRKDQTHERKMELLEARVILLLLS
jgi:hypothetical protein